MLVYIIVYLTMLLCPYFSCINGILNKKNPTIYLLQIFQVKYCYFNFCIESLISCTDDLQRFAAVVERYYCKSYELYIMRLENYCVTKPDL